MKCQLCPRHRICSGTHTEDVKPIDYDRLQDLFFHDVTMTESVLSFV